MGVHGDPDQSFVWYYKAAAQGLPDAQYKIGFCLEKGMGTIRSDSEAVTWYRKAAEQGLVDAQLALAICYEEERGVKRDYRQKLYWYRAAAEQGMAHAQAKAARCYYYGQGVDERDYAEAYKWALIADRNGSEEAGELLEALRKNYEKRITPEHLAEGEKRANTFKPKKAQR
jgi:TPR repeat protein